MILSKRRLIFAPDQAFFQCQQMHCVESLLPRSQDIEPDHGFNSLLMRPLPRNGIGESAKDIYDRLHEYTGARPFLRGRYI